MPRKKVFLIAAFNKITFNSSFRILVWTVKYSLIFFPAKLYKYFNEFRLTFYMSLEIKRQCIFHMCSLYIHVLALCKYIMIFMQILHWFFFQSACQEILLSGPSFYFNFSKVNLLLKNLPRILLGYYLTCQTHPIYQFTRHHIYMYILINFWEIWHFALNIWKDTCMTKSSFFALNVTFFSKIYGKKMHIYFRNYFDFLYCNISLILLVVLFSRFKLCLLSLPILTTIN